MVEHSTADDSASSPEIEHAPHFELLRLLAEHPNYSQRQMAIALGVSVGKTHYLLKALLRKGLVKAQKFQRSPNKLGYLYRLTPNGLAHRLHLTQSFLARKEQEYAALKEEIASLRRELASEEQAAREFSPSGYPIP